MDKIKVELTTPIQAHGETVNFVLLDPPTGKTIRAIAKCSTEEEKGLKIVEVLAHIPQGSVDQISMIDLETIMEALGPFLSKSR